MLPYNREGSLRRLSRLHRKLERQNLTPAYEEIIEEQRHAGVMERAEGPCVGSREFYIPHKPVVRATAESPRSLRNEEDDGYEDFIKKCKIALLISLRNYFMSFRVKNV